MRTALVIGTGLIGTSIALALTAHGVAVHLADHDPEQARAAAARGGGTDAPPAGVVDLAVIAVPPAHVARVLVNAMGKGTARAYVDVASVKGALQRELEGIGLDLSSYVGSHPMAGREVSGPLAATGDLFAGRPWVLTPTQDTDAETAGAALELITYCGAVPVVMDADAHDSAVALVSHLPHLFSSIVAGRLENADEEAVRLCGTGIRDVTRIAASDPAMWTDILCANAGPLTVLLEQVIHDVVDAVRALRRWQYGNTPDRRTAATGVEELLRRGNAGQRRIPDKHGAPRRAYETVAVLIDDQPGQLARIFAGAELLEVNIEDVWIDHAKGRQAGFVRLVVDPEAAPGLAAAFREWGWTVRP